MATTYAIIAVGGKQYRVREGERLLVDRLKTEEGKTFHPNVLFLGGDGNGQLAPSAQVTVKVLGHLQGDKIRIGKRRAKKGYRRQTGFRAQLSQIEIQTIGAAKRTAASAPAQKEAPPPRAKEAPAAAAPAQPPRGYAEFTVVEIGEKSKRWRLEQLEAALKFERANANRKGAIAALEHAIETKKER